MDIEGARRITAARREIEKAEDEEATQSSNETMSPHERLGRAYWRIYRQKGGAPMGWDDDMIAAKGFSTGIVAEDGSKLSLDLMTFIAERRGGGPMVRTVTAVWKGDGEKIGHTVKVSDEPMLPREAEKADEKLKRELTRLEEALDAADFMIAASTEAEAA